MTGDLPIANVYIWTYTYLPTYLPTYLVPGYLDRLPQSLFKKDYDRPVLPGMYRHTIQYSLTASHHLRLPSSMTFTTLVAPRPQSTTPPMFHHTHSMDACGPVGLWGRLDYHHSTHRCRRIGITMLFIYSNAASLSV